MTTPGIKLNDNHMELNDQPAQDVKKKTEGTEDNGNVSSTELGKDPVVSNPKDRWGKLKTTITVVNNIHTRKQKRLDRGDSFLRKFSTRNQTELDVSIDCDDTQSSLEFHNTKHRTFKSLVIHPSGGIMFYWLGVVTLTVMYNLWTCIAREAFREIQRGYMALWFCLDGLGDFIYVCDIVVQFRTGYLNQGLMVYDSSKLCKNYMKEKCFIIDIICLLPLDFIQFYTGIHPMLRFPRFLKIYRSIRFMHMYESRTAYPNLLRVANLSHILFLGSHWFAAFYYLISEAEGFEGDWSYPKPEGHYAAVTRKYLASLYWSTLTLTTIGDLPPPDTNWQYVFVIVSYLIGVFIFATIVGQVGNVITNRNASRQEFERLLDGAKFYMQMHNVPTDLQKRVQRWYDYVWTRGRLNCNDINSLGLLPDKLKTELALHVNLGTLKKVTIFQKCRPEFLHDLMLKMRAYIFTPGDLICRRGEVAREMFIIADGVVEILGGNGTVLTQMSTGDFFGEIGILNLDGGINRRTADVRSVGYSELFVLSREDVLAALKDHPDAENIIREYGQRRLKETEEHRKMVRSAPSSPDPSAFRMGKATNKVHTENKGPALKQLQQVKVLQRLPNMSPKLRKFFNIRNRRITRRNSRKKSDGANPENVANLIPVQGSEGGYDNVLVEPIKKENGLRTNLTSGLHSIREKDHSDTDNEGNVSDTVKENNGAKLADLVLSLLKTKRQMGGYNTVGADDKDTEREFADIKIDNLGEITRTNKDPLCQTKSCPPGNNNSKKLSGSSDELPKEPPKERSRFLDKLMSRRKSSVADTSSLSSTKSSTKDRFSPPKITLTPDTDKSPSSSLTNSDSDSDSSVQQPSSHLQQRRNHVTRQSSPCILPIPSLLTSSPARKYSCSPPLDLPIEVPQFSNFRGLAGNTSEIQLSLARFKSNIERRLNDIETSFKETQQSVQESTTMQEKMMKTILKRLPKEKTKGNSSGTTSRNHSPAKSTTDDVNGTDVGNSVVKVNHTQTVSQQSGNNSLLGAMKDSQNESVCESHDSDDVTCGSDSDDDVVGGELRAETTHLEMCDIACGNGTERTDLSESENSDTADTCMSDIEDDDMRVTHL